MTTTVNSNTATIIPYMRGQDILFFSKSLKPDRKAHFFFDDKNIDGFVQRASVLSAANGFDASQLHEGTGLYCRTTRAFASVIGVSETYPDHKIYIKEEYLSLNVVPIAPNSLAPSDFNVGDIVSNDPVYYTYYYRGSPNSFVGKVEYYNSGDGLLVLSPIFGTANAITANTIHNIRNFKTANILNVVVNTRFPSTETVNTTSGIAFSFTANTYNNYHGIIIDKSANTSNIHLMTVPSFGESPDNTIYITSGSGFTQNAVIFSVDGFSANAILVTGINSLDGTSRYSIGDAQVDDIGAIAGIFSVPEHPYWGFKVGTKMFSISDTLTLDDPNSQMHSTAQFYAGGYLTYPYRFSPVVVPVLPNANTSVNQFIATPSASVRSGGYTNYLAQTFFTPQANNSNNIDSGIFLTSVDLFFSKKPDILSSDIGLPVTVRIVSVQNGYPTSDILAEVSVPCNKVNVADGNNTTPLYPSSNDSRTSTKFAFPDPVYLAPGGQYAIVVHSDSPSYEVWISQIGENVVGDPNYTRVSNQPYAGSFFTSQNASTWDSFQNQDLMFVLNKAQFVTDVNPVLQFNLDTPQTTSYLDSIYINSSDTAFPNTGITYSFKSTLANQGTPVQDSNYTIIPTQTLYNFSSDLKVSSSLSNRERIILAGDPNSMLVDVSLSTTNPDITPIFNHETISMVGYDNLINDGHLSANSITITNPGYHSNAANIVVIIGPSQLYPSDPTAQAHAYVASSGLSGNNLIEITFDNVGRGYYMAPTITISENVATTNATAVISSEDGKSGGNALMRYITKIITLADGFDSGDIRVYVDAVVPTGTFVVAFYKVLSASDTDSIDNKRWQPMYLTNAVTNSPDTATPIELVYQPSSNPGTLSYTENGVKYPLGGTFKYFQIKLVCFAEDDSVPPVINSFRAIALPSG